MGHAAAPTRRRGCVAGHAAAPTRRRGCMAGHAAAPPRRRGCVGGHVAVPRGQAGPVLVPRIDNRAVLTSLEPRGCSSSCSPESDYRFRVADPDPDWIRIQSGQWIQGGKNDPQK